MPKGYAKNGINKGQFQKGNKTGFQKGNKTGFQKGHTINRGRKYLTRKSSAPFSKEHRKHISESADKVRESIKRWYADPKNREIILAKSKKTSEALKGRKPSEETRQKMRQSSKGRENSIGAIKKGWDRILREIPELEKQGFFCIPITNVIPDIIGIKDGKIYAIEVEYGKPNYSKYSIEKRKYFEDVIWILRKR